MHLISNVGSVPPPCEKSKQDKAMYMAGIITIVVGGVLLIAAIAVMASRRGGMRGSGGMGGYRMRIA